MQITFDIPEAAIPRIINAMKGLFPIPMIPVDPNDPQGEKEPEFTNAQWAKERVRRFIIETVFRYEKREAERTLAVQRDNEIAA